MHFTVLQLGYCTVCGRGCSAAIRLYSVLTH